MVSDKIKQIMKMKKVTSVQLAQHLGMLRNHLQINFQGEAYPQMN